MATSSSRGTAGMATPSTSVYFSIHTNGIKRDKLDTLCVQLQELVRDTPDHIYFNLKTFNDKSQIITHGSRKYGLFIAAFDIEVEILRNMARSNKAFVYDAWKCLLQQCVKDSAKVKHVVIFTDDEDSGSIQTNLQELVNLTAAELKPTFQFTFIKVGEDKVVGPMLRETCSSEFCGTINVEDCVSGWIRAFELLQTRILIQLETANFQAEAHFREGADGLSTATAVDKGLDLGEAATAMALMSVSDEDEASSSNIAKPGPSGSGTGTARTSSLFENVPSGGSASGSSGHGQAAGRNSGGGSGSGTPRSPCGLHDHTEDEVDGCGWVETFHRASGHGMEDPRQSRQSYLVRIENIPFNTSNRDILAIFQQWGSCQMKCYGTTANSKKRWMEIIYRRKEAFLSAIQFGSNVFVEGGKLVVFSLLELD